MRPSIPLGVLCTVLPASVLLGIGNIKFDGPLTIGNIPRAPWTVHEGDFNKDGKIDLVASNGTGIVTVLLQDPANREVWTQVPVRVGSSCFFTRGGDFDGDGIDDLAVADNASTAYFIRSNGDGTFEKPLPITQSRGPRWVATGDWNKDGRLDFATSNLNSSTITFFVNELTPEGKLNFRLTQNPPSGREHTMEALDYDGDGLTDIAVGQGLPGIQLHKGQGDGKFLLKGNVSNMGCIEYIATGDFNNDGKSDLATTCIDDQNAYAAFSNGTGTYTRSLVYPFGVGTESTAIGDVTGDGNDDLAMVSEQSGILKIFPGTGDGKFAPPVDFAPVGTGPRFLITADLDVDGHLDVISADTGGTTLTVFFGRDGERFLESADSVTGYIAAKSFGVDDFDHDGIPDLFFTASALNKAYIYLKPGGTSPNKSTYTVDLTFKLRPSDGVYTSLAVVDLDGDGIPDLAGTNLTGDTMQVALLDATGKAHDELSVPCGDAPQEIRAGLIDAGSTIDLAIPAQGSNQISLFFGTGDGKFSDLKAVPTIEKPKRLSLGDLDGDQKTDMVVITARIAAVHYQTETGNGEFGAPEQLIMDTTKIFNDSLIADLNGDGKADILLAESRTAGVLLFAGLGNHAFAPPVPIKLGGAPVYISLVDVDGDGLLDLTGSIGAGQAVGVAQNLGPAGFADPELFRIGTALQSHRILDMNGDGVLDIVAFGASSSTIRIGHISGPPPEPRFRRGDADGSGRVEITDAVQTLNWLFRESKPLACEDAADTNDDGKIDLTDPVATLNWLFREGAEPAPPGALNCGVDPNPDDLKRCFARC